jgi:hypothetical protein
LGKKNLVVLEKKGRGTISQRGSGVKADSATGVTINIAVSLDGFFLKIYNSYESYGFKKLCNYSCRHHLQEGSKCLWNLPPCLTPSWRWRLNSD